MNADNAAAALPERLAKSSINKLYKLGEVLSEDTTGILYAAGVKVQGREAAVYVLTPGAVIASRSLIRLDHPNICRAHRVLRLKDGTSAVIIDRPEGRPILTFVQESRRFGLNQSISAVLQLLSALHAVHLTGKTVRNLNVNNVFLHKDADGNLRLKLVSVGIEGAGVDLKAPHYFSPERIMDVDKGDPRSDIWSAGAMLHHLCYGRLPFSGETSVELARSSMLETPDFNVPGRTMPDALVDVLRRALNRDERKRYQNVSEMVGDLLPLRDVYDEPMSEDVSAALENSYPPPPPESGKLAPKKPQPVAAMSRTAATQRTADRVGRIRSNDATVEYGTEKPTASKRKDAARFFGTPVGAKSQGRPTPEKSLYKPRLGDKSSMTLHGIPTSFAQGGETPKGEGEDSLFSPRSILGSDEEIKQLEDEMGFLEHREDEEIPTLVINNGNLAALMGKGTTEKSEPKPQKADKERAAEQAEKAPAEKRAARPAARKTSAATKLNIRKPELKKLPVKRLSDDKKNEEKPDMAVPRTPTERASKSPTPLDDADLKPLSADSKLASMKKTRLGMTVPAAFRTGARQPKKDLVADEVEPPAAAGPANGGEMESPEEPISISGAVLLPSASPEAPAPLSEETEMTPIAVHATPVRRLVDRVRSDKRLLIGSGAALCVVIAIVAISLGFGAGDDAGKAPVKNAFSPSKPVEKVVDVEPAEKPALPSTAASVVDVEPAEKPALPSAAAPSESVSAATEGKAERLETVSIQFQNVPAGAEVKADGEPTALPVSLPWSKEVVKIVIHAQGYAPFKVGVVPDRDRNIPIRMKKKSAHSKKKKHGPKGRKKTGASLVSNPFKK